MNIQTHQIVTRATELVPLLQQRSAEADRLGRLPDDVVQSLKQADLLSLLRPRRYGGLEVGLHAYLDAAIEIARGCGSAGWVATQMNNTIFMAALGPKAMRDELFADPEVYMASVLTGQTSVRRAPGGYVIDGRWPFCSGCQHANWIFVGAMLDGPQGLPAHANFLVPARELEVLDDWKVSGFAGTSSNSVVAKELFVPESRFFWSMPVFQGETEPEDLDAPLYRVPVLAFMLLSAAGTGVGMAQAMLDEFTAQLPGRGILFTTYDKRSEAAVTHLQVAEVAMKIEAAHLLLKGGLADLEAYAERHDVVPIDTRLRARTQAVYATQLCLEAVNLLFGASGARALSLSNPLQRIVRDVQALCVHPVYSAQAQYETYGRVLLGLAPNMFLI